MLKRPAPFPASYPLVSTCKTIIERRRFASNASTPALRAAKGYGLGQERLNQIIDRTNAVIDGAFLRRAAIAEFIDNAAVRDVNLQVEAHDA